MADWEDMRAAQEAIVAGHEIIEQVHATLAEVQTKIKGEEGEEDSIVHQLQHYARLADKEIRALFDTMKHLYINAVHYEQIEKKSVGMRGKTIGKIANLHHEQLHDIKANEEEEVAKVEAEIAELTEIMEKIKELEERGISVAGDIEGALVKLQPIVEHIKFQISEEEE